MRFGVESEGEVSVRSTFVGEAKPLRHHGPGRRPVFCIAYQESSFPGGCLKDKILTKNGKKMSTIYLGSSAPADLDLSHQCVLQPVNLKKGKSSDSRRYLKVDFAELHGCAEI